MLIGLGGGAASSQTSAEESAELDFASVQRYVANKILSFLLQQAGFGKTSFIRNGARAGFRSKHC